MRLIVNADDFGLTENVSRGIIDGIKNGIITDTSAMVTTEGFLPSIELARVNNFNCMGLHFVVTEGNSILPLEQIPSLVDEMGFFYPKEIFFHKDINISEMEAELEAQINVFLSTGLVLTHLDTHHGFMLKNKSVFELFMKLAKKYNVPLRNEASALSFEERRWYINRLNEEGIKSVEQVYFNTGVSHHLYEDICIFLGKAIGIFDSIEIGCHPGISDSELRMISKLNDDREIELNLFKSSDLRDKLKTMEIELVNYSNL
jgi:chitin disaccharide deacetylase